MILAWRLLPSLFFSVSFNARVIPDITHSHFAGQNRALVGLVSSPLWCGLAARRAEHASMSFSSPMKARKARPRKKRWAHDNSRVAVRGYSLSVVIFIAASKKQKGKRGWDASEGVGRRPMFSPQKGAKRHSRAVMRARVRYFPIVRYSPVFVGAFLYPARDEKPKWRAVAGAASCDSVILLDPGYLGGGGSATKRARVYTRRIKQRRKRNCNGIASRQPTVLARRARARSVGNSRRNAKIAPNLLFHRARSIET